MELPFKIGKEPENVSISQFECYVSQEVYEYLSGIENQPLNFITCRGILKKIVIIDNYEKNRIFIHGYEDDSTANLELTDENNICELEIVELECSDINKDMLKDMEKFVTDHSSIPTAKGEVMNVVGYNFHVKLCSPVLQGLWTDNTKMILSKKNKDGSQENLEVLRYSLPLISRPDATSLLFNSFKSLLKKSYTYEIAEIPSEISEKYSDSTSEFSTSSVCFISSIFQSCGKFGQFYVWPCYSSVPLIMPIFYAECLSKNKIFITPSAVENFELNFKNKATYPMLQNLSNFKYKEAVEVKAKVLRIYEDVTDDQLDGILANYFKGNGKICYFSQNQKTLIEIPTEKYFKDMPYHHESSCFPKSFHFELSLVGHEEAGYFKVSSKSTLTRYSGIERALPVVSKRFTGSLILNIFPKLITKSAQIISKYFRETKARKLLVHGHSGSGKEELISAVAHFTGLPIRKYDSRNILSDTSGSTEAKLRHIFDNSSNYSCILVLLNVQVLAKKDGAIDYRVLSSFEQHLNEAKFKILCIGDLKSSIDGKLAEMFDLDLPLANPETFEDRLDILTWNLNNESRIYYDIKDIEELARSTAGLLYKDLTFMVQNAIAETFESSMENLGKYGLLFCLSVCISATW